MDGGGRLDQSLMRSGQSAAKETGAPVDEPASARVQPEYHHAAGRFAWWAAYRRLGGRRGAKIAHLPLPQGVGVVASMLLLAATLGYGVIAGQHVPDVVNWFKDARDVAANSIGFRIAAIALTGQKEVSREEVLTTAGVTGRASLLFLDADAARRRSDG